MTNKIVQFLKDSINDLKSQKATNCRFILDDRLAIFCGLSGANDDEIVAGLKVWTSDDLWCDYDFLNFPYFEESGECLANDEIITEATDLENMAKWLLGCYKTIKDFDIEENGLIKQVSFDFAYGYLIDSTAFTEKELELVTNLLGNNLEALEEAITVRFGVRSFIDFYEDGLHE